MPQTAPAQAPEAPSPENEAWAEALWLPCQLSFELPIPGFTIGDLLRLQVESVVETQRAEGTDIEVQLNGQTIGWAEFEVVGDRLAFRFTELE